PCLDDERLRTNCNWQRTGNTAAAERPRWIAGERSTRSARLSILEAVVRSGDLRGHCVRAIIRLASNLQDTLQSGAGPADTALHGTHRAIANRRSFFIRKSGRADQDHRLALIVWKLRQGLLEVLHIHRAILRRMHRQPLGKSPV